MCIRDSPTAALGPAGRRTQYSDTFGRRHLWSALAHQGHAAFARFSPTPDPERQSARGRPTAQPAAPSFRAAARA
eukprot:2718105-Pyramimonas_sp.AAC.1